MQHTDETDIQNGNKTESTEQENNRYGKIRLGTVLTCDLLASFSITAESALPLLFAATELRALHLQRCIPCILLFYWVIVIMEFNLLSPLGFFCHKLNSLLFSSLNNNLLLCDTSLAAGRNCQKSNLLGS